MLKKAWQAVLFSFLPQAIQEKAAQKKVGGDDVTHLALYPPEFNIEDMDLSKTIAFLPYCCKPQGCPADDNRKSEYCNLKIGEQCDYGNMCDVGRWIKVLERAGIKTHNIFIIDSDDNLFNWLKFKREARYKYVVGFGCTFSILYAIDYVFDTLGFKGVVGYIQGDTCSTIREDRKSVV